MLDDEGPVKDCAGRWIGEGCRVRDDDGEVGTVTSIQNDDDGHKAFVRFPLITHAGVTYSQEFFPQEGGVVWELTAVEETDEDRKALADAVAYRKKHPATEPVSAYKVRVIE